VGSPGENQSVSFLILCELLYDRLINLHYKTWEKDCVGISNWRDICRWDFFQYRRKVVEKMEIELAFQMAMKTWSRWIRKNVNMNNTKVFFRSISPEHKEKQWCYNETKPIMDESYEAIFPKSIVEIVERTIGSMSTAVRYLNITKLSQYRRDAHPTVYTKKQGKLLIAKEQRQPMSYGDCSHWCLPGLPDTWNRLLYASVVSDNSRDSSSS
jgi:hypothetical protein